MAIGRFILFVAALAAQTTPAWALDDARVARDGSTLTVSWTAKKPVDVYVAERADAAPAAAKLVSRADGDGNFTMPDAGTTRRYFILREAGQKGAVRTAERLLPLEQGSNFRDIGGYESAGGKRVRWGLIYRSGATPLLTEADVAKVKELGLTDMIDLRSSEERVIAPTRITGIRYSAINYSMMSMMGDRRALTNGSALYHNFPAFFAPQLRIVFDDLLRREGPIVYNCSAGQDRTGFATAMVLSALGVPRATIIADYHLSTGYRRPENELPPIDDAMAKTSPVAGMFAALQKSPMARVALPLKEADGTPFLAGAFAEIDAKWGSVDSYLEKEVGVTKGDLALLRATYLE
jgi:protein-tyrosine phosphatase